MTKTICGLAEVIYIITDAGYLPSCLEKGAHLQGGSMQFTNARESMKSPLAKKLFQVDGVTNIFFGSDFVTVTKSDDYTWNVVKPDIFAGIMDHFTSGVYV